MSDTAVSAAWRFAMGRNPAHELLSSGKAAPVSELPNGSLLVKPLFYVREFESQAFARETGFVAACCGCPACRYPSRRDVTEETFLLAFRRPLWEFDVPGVCELIKARGGEVLGPVLEMSAPGLETKKNHLPPDFFRFAVEWYLRRLDKSGHEDYGAREIHTRRLSPKVSMALRRCLGVSGQRRRHLSAWQSPSPGAEISG